jgi:membrane protease subunit HflK
VRTVAQGYREASIARATGDSARFSLLLAQYAAAPAVTRERLWLETVEQVLAGNRTIVGDGRQLIYVPMPGSGAVGAAAAAAGTPPLLTPDMVAPAVGATVPATPRAVREPRPDGREGREEPGR